MELITAVSCTSTNNVCDARTILDSLTSTAAFDFETASKWSDDTKLLLRADLELTEDREERRIIQQKIDSDGLSHPSLVRVTHMSMATSPRDGYVFIMDNEDILDYSYELAGHNKHSSNLAQRFLSTSGKFTTIPDNFQSSTRTRN